VSCRVPVKLDVQQQFNSNDPFRGLLINDVVNLLCNRNSDSCSDRRIIIIVTAIIIISFDDRLFLISWQFLSGQWRHCVTCRRIGCRTRSRSMVMALITAAVLSLIILFSLQLICAAITCKRAALSSVKDDHTFLWKHAIFRHLPSRNPSTDQDEILHD
jgi:hypothetical protein